jgi:hypothetical protein
MAIARSPEEPMRTAPPIIWLALATALAPTLSAQRPRIGVGIGGGTVLGSQLLDHDFATTLGDSELEVAQQFDLDDVSVFSAHGEWYVNRHIALRGHAAIGEGRLEITTSGSGVGVVANLAHEQDPGNVRIRAFDAGLSLWPWAPMTVGFAPFLTLGVGTYSYDFDAVDLNGFFRADGERSGRALLVGIGADMSVWRSITLRMEAMNHLVDSPLRESDFAVPLGPGASSALNETVSNVRIVIGAHIYFPFTDGDAGEGP